MTSHSGNFRHSSKAHTTVLAIGPYQVQRELARGGMGVVYLAQGPGGEEVAIKVLLDSGLADEKLLRRFQREAKALLALDHPAILKVQSFGVERGHPYLVMEFLEGETLSERVARQGPLPCDEVIAWGRTMADALDHAHSRGIAHRDMKPANVILRGGAPVIVDFGLVRSLRGDSSRLTETGAVVGSPAFMAPEQAHGDPRSVGPGSDVYGLGATLYYLLTGKPPFDGAGMLEVLSRVVSDPPVEPRRFRPDLDPALEEVVLRCLAKEPRARYANAAALSSALAGLALVAPTASTQRRPSGLGLGLLIGVGVGCVGGLLLVRGGTVSPEHRAEAPRVAPVEPGSERTVDPAVGREEASRARELANQARWAAAEDAYSRALLHATTAGQAADWHTGRGTVRLELEDPERALDDLLEADRLRPEDPRVLHSLSVALEWLERYAEALEASTRALALAGRSMAPRTHAAVLVVHSRLLIEAGDFDGALNASTEALKLTPKSPAAEISCAQANYALGRMQQSMEHCGAALSLDARYGPVFVEQARFHTRVDKLERAAESLSRALELGLREPLATKVRAQRDLLQRALQLRHEAGVFARAGNLERALANYEAVLALLPRTAGVRVWGSELLSALGRFPEALRELELAQELEPNNPHLQYLRAHALGRVGRSREAANLFDTALRGGLPPSLASIARRERDRLVKELRGE